MPLSSPRAAPFLIRRTPSFRFVGRARELERLHAVLRGDERAIGIVGASGVGKTALAAAYAEHHRHDHPGGVFWVDASSDAGASFARLGEAVGLRPKGPASDRRRQLGVAFARYLDDRPNA